MKTAPSAKFRASAWTALTCLCVALGGAAPGMAQPSRDSVPTRSSASRIIQWLEPDRLTTEEVAFVMHDFARCVARRQEAQGRRLLASQPESPEQDRAVDSLVRGGNRCLRAVRMRMPASYFRGALAESFLETTPARTPVPTATVESYQDFFARLSAADTDGIDAEDRAYLDGRWIAYCYARDNDAAIMRLLATEPASAAERAVLAELRDGLLACGRGGSPALGPLAMRSLLADALYRKGI